MINELYILSLFRSSAWETSQDGKGYPDSGFAAK